MAQQTAAFTYPSDLFIVRDDEGKLRYYSEDPFRNPNPRAAEIKDIGEYLVTFFQDSDIDACNPLQIRLKGVHHRRADKFDIMKLSKVIQRTIPYSLADGCGNSVRIKEIGAEVQTEESREYPYVGELVDNKGRVLATRRYDENGNCSDGRRSHRLVMMIESPAAYSEPAETVTRGQKIR